MRSSRLAGRCSYANVRDRNPTTDSLTGLPNRRYPALDCLIEGIERHEQLDRVHEPGDRMVQAYLFARPIAIDALLTWLARDLKPMSRDRAPATSPLRAAGRPH